MYEGPPTVPLAAIFPSLPPSTHLFSSKGLPGQGRYQGEEDGNGEDHRIMINRIKRMMITMIMIVFFVIMVMMLMIFIMTNFMLKIVILRTMDVIILKEIILILIKILRGMLGTLF